MIGELVQEVARPHCPDRLRRTKRLVLHDPVFETPLEDINSPSADTLGSIVKDFSDICVTETRDQTDLAAGVPVSIDYSKIYHETGNRPANFISAPTKSSDRFPGYPRLNRLDHLKRELVELTAHVPLVLPFHYHPQHPYSLRDVLGHQNKFDAILLNTPKGVHIRDLYALRIDQICHLPSFLFILVRESTPSNLEEARQLIAQWGFRRAEDIVWIKSNVHSIPGTRPSSENGLLFVNAKEHCLMNIKGTVRRSTDGHLIHCNVDTDVILAEEFNSEGKRQKPEDLYRTIENFCQGLRRLEIFCDRPRPGWVSLDRKYRSANYHPILYAQLWANGHLMPYNFEIDELRPKSPSISMPKSRAQSSQPYAHGMSNVRHRQLNSGNENLLSSHDPYWWNPVA